MTKWLVTGATGLLGSNALVQLAEKGSVVGAVRNVPPTAANKFEFVRADLTQNAGFSDVVARTSTTAVLHAAAISSIEECERQPELARRVNVEASAELATQAAESEAAFVYISTDAVFDGERGCYTELDVASPTTEYGRSKLAGERAVLDANPDALVARVNFYGWSPSGQRSLAEFFYRRLSRGEEVPGFQDVVVSTLYVNFLVDLIEKLVERGANGIVNVVSSEATTKYDFGERLARSFGFDPELVRPALSTDYLSVKRGSRLDLNTERMKGLLGSSIPGQQEGVDNLFSDFQAGRIDTISAFYAGKECK